LKAVTDQCSGPAWRLTITKTGNIHGRDKRGEF
jgi:hypothetical protein